MLSLPGNVHIDPKAFLIVSGCGLAFLTCQYAISDEPKRETITMNCPSADDTSTIKTEFKYAALHKEKNEQGRHVITKWNGNDVVACEGATFTP